MVAAPLAISLSGWLHAADSDNTAPLLFPVSHQAAALGDLVPAAPGHVSSYLSQLSVETRGSSVRNQPEPAIIMARCYPATHDEFHPSGLDRN
ncbi:hypothetical protein PCANC_18470 [Puccinia coronata f. sp. avenae]|uniref:Uncharacterized protein n=1 Tax=Puccinia coronata f. sp. avenae TaxID=200324 RepID=A0A2N5U5R0_9BASI|nr:hypothetical protein PCANC_18470 [Puccinia coronata f. sp. avenae]PLW21706.1 hypothetical protein PCASD_16695 [Puccinia coronata f. sp. avenae]PLW33060.1 hypothetical protein PCASD_12907 [Puccinia coronata f. sp. avenae]